MFICYCYVTNRHIAYILMVLFQVLRLKTSDGIITDATDMYCEDGTKYISGATVAARYEEKLLVGTLTNKAVMCHISYMD